MKLITLFLISLSISNVSLAWEEGDEDHPDYGRWVCGAIVPQRPWRVITVRKTGLESEIRQEAIDECNRVVILKNCVSTGCRRARR